MKTVLTGIVLVIVFSIALIFTNRAHPMCCHIART